MSTTKLLTNLLFIPLCCLTACIGTDLVDEPLGTDLSRVDIRDNQLSLMLAETQQLFAQYYNFQGEESNSLLTWESKNPGIASVNQEGLVTAIATGQAWITVTAEDSNRDSIAVTVVQDANAVAIIEISGSNNVLDEGGQVQLSANARNINGDLLNNLTLTWTSTNAGVASVDANGLVTAIASGSTNITASADGVNSLPYTISVGGNDRSGEFTGLTGHSVSGRVSLSRDGNDFIIRLESDFQTQSGPGLYVYYSKDANAVDFVDLGKLQETSGEQTYTVPSSINTDEYNFVQIWCQPFGINFGVAELQ